MHTPSRVAEAGAGSPGALCCGLLTDLADGSHQALLPPQLARAGDQAPRCEQRSARRERRRAHILVNVRAHRLQRWQEGSRNDRSGLRAGCACAAPGLCVPGWLSCRPMEQSLIVQALSDCKRPHRAQLLGCCRCRAAVRVDHSADLRRQGAASASASAMPQTRTSGLPGAGTICMACWQPEWTHRAPTPHCCARSMLFCASDLPALAALSPSLQREGPACGCRVGGLSGPQNLGHSIPGCAAHNLVEVGRQAQHRLQPAPSQSGWVSAWPVWEQDARRSSTCSQPASLPVGQCSAADSCGTRHLQALHTRGREGPGWGSEGA